MCTVRRNESRLSIVNARNSLAPNLQCISGTSTTLVNKSLKFISLVAVASREIGLEWDSIVCHKGTIRRAVGITVLGIVLSGLAAAQGINWRRVGNSAVNLLLASPATGPVEKVWFSENGSTLYARTRSGRVFETSDYEVWLPSQNTLEPATPAQRLPWPARRKTECVWCRLVSAGFTPWACSCSAPTMADAVGPI